MQTKRDLVTILAAINPDFDRLRSQIRKQMSGPDLHVITFNFLALKKLVFPP